MPMYTISGRTTAVTATANAPLAMLLKAPSNALMRISEIGITLATAVASTLGLARSTTATTTPTSLGTPTPLNPRDSAATGVAAVAWTTVGAATGIPLRRVTLPATIGGGIVWQFLPEELILDGSVAATAELFLTNLVAVAPGLIDTYIQWRE